MERMAKHSQDVVLDEAVVAPISEHERGIRRNREVMHAQKSLP
jgi:hypothetical protein